MRLLQQLAVLLLLACGLGAARAEMYPVSLEQRSNAAARIAIGTVADQHAYWVEGQGAVTASTVKVAAWLKGASSEDEIVVLALGGVVGDRATVVMPSLGLEIGQEYILFLDAEESRLHDRDLKRARPGLRQSFAYADAQGAMPYQMDKYRDIFGPALTPNEALARIASLVGQRATTPTGDTYNARQPSPQPAIQILPITSFSPNPTRAGTIVAGDFLTITGSGFGAAAGTVFYTNANDGGATFTSTGIASDNVSWADASIVNKPSRLAGTGPININGAMTSGTNLTVNWAHIDLNNTFSGFATSTRQRYYLRNLNGTGGMSFLYNTGGFSANAPAVAAFERAMTSWRCNGVGINFVPGGTTAVGFGDDNVNVVMFDGTLPAGVLGRATSRFSGSANGACNLQNTVWWLEEVDVQFFTDPPTAGFPWEYGPAAPAFSEYDFETVAVHELGHAVGLGHRIAAGQTMNFSISNGAQARTPAAFEIEAAQNKLAYSDDATCFNPTSSGTPMVPVVPAVCDLATPVADVSITKTDGAASEIPGTTVSYTIVAANAAGPSSATGVTVSDTFPAALSGCSTTSVAAGGATGHDAGPTAGNISDGGITLPVGGSVTYTSTCTIGAAATGSLANTASVSATTADSNAANNSATDTDSLTATADVAVTKTDGSASEIPGTSVSYTIVATNAGPSVATGVTVADTFPGSLSGCSTTSVAAGGATGHDVGPTAGNINDSGITLPVGGSVTYTATCTIAANATGSLANTATVSTAVTDSNSANNSATDTDTLNVTADLSITKTDGAASEVPGTSVTYTIVASNASGPSVATGVTVADTFVAALTGCSTTSVVAGGATGHDPGPTAGNINDSGITLPVGGSVTYTSTCTIAATATGSLANTATVSTSVTDGNAANNSATDTDTLTATADVAITKTDGSATEIPGTSATYTIVASNPSGPSVATGVTVADTFVAALSGCSTTSVAAGGATGHDAGPTAGNINDSGITLPVGGTVTYTATCTIDAAATGSLANTATVSTAVADGAPGNNSATDTDTLSATADVAITKTDGAASEIPGTSVTYTIVASNAGPSVATGVTVADTFPGTLSGCSTTSVAAGGATGHDTGPMLGNINDSGITLPAGSSVTYTATCTIAATATGTLANTATVSTAVTDPTPGNNSATDTDTLTATADVAITKTDGAANEVPGTSVTYTIVASNASGPSVATGVTVADTFVAALTGCSTTSVAAGGATGNDAGPTAGNINDSGITLPVGGSVTYTSTCTIAASATGTLANTATASTAVTDPTPGNNSATDTDTLTATADVAITKTDGSATEIPGTSVTYTIVASNASGPSVATGVTVADTFVAALTGCSTTSVAAGGATGHDAGPTAGNINDSGITLPVGGSVTYTSTCTIAASATGSLANTASVTSAVTDGNAANDSATDTDTLNATADVAITKTDGSATEIPGTSVTYTIVASNSVGPSVATGVTVADTFVAALTGCSTTSVAAGGATGHDAGPTAGNINDSGITLPVGGSVTYTSTCTIAASATGSLANTASVTSAVTDGNAANDSATDTDTLNATADVAITKTDGSATEVPGTSVTYTIVASNSVGPSVATGVTVADTFVAALTGCSTTSVAAGGASGHDAGPTLGNINDSGITLPVGASVTYTSTCTIAATATGTLANTATVSTAVSDGTPGNNSATDTDTLTVTADLAITKTDGAASEVPGTSVTYTIVASNASGPSVATGVTVADTFVATLTGCSTTSVAAGGASGNDAGPTAGNINDSGITLPVGGSVTYTATCTIAATATGSLANTATISGAVSDGNAANDSATDTDTLTATADVAITKSDGAASEVPGTSVTYTIVASNSSGPSVATGVTVADTFVAALTGCSTTSVAAGGATGHDAGPIVGNINDSGITLPVGGSVTYTSTCTIAATATGSLANTATITTAVSDGNAANDSATDTDTLTATADVAITKTDGAASEVPGTSVTYTIVASNPSGPSVATGVTVADTFVAALTGCSTTSVAAGGATGHDAGPTAGNINDSGITLPVGGSVTYTATCTIAATATGSLANTATVSTAVTDGTAGNNSATDTDTLTATADVAITKTDGSASEVPGTSVTYTIVASNPSGPSAATGVAVADTFVADLVGCSTTSVAAGGATGNDAGPIIGNINDGGITLPVAGSVTYTATCTISPTATGALANTATVTSAVSDGNAANDSATDSDTLGASADLAITKTDGALTEVPGTTVSYTITVGNATGPSAATGVTVTDTFDAMLTGCSTTSVAAGGASGHDAGPTPGHINDSGITLPVGASVTYTATCTIDAAATGNLVNSASVASAVTDPVPGNNNASDSDTLLPQAELSVSKSDFSSIAIIGGFATYTITAFNDGPSAAPGAAVSDSAPVGCDSYVWSCSGDFGGSCTANGSGNINDTVDLPPAATVTYIATCAVADNASGTLTNTVTVSHAALDGTPGDNSATDVDLLVEDDVFKNGFE